ncbi:MAG: hypothetical protein JNK37_18295 [Verrucomicrobiales bacterium]|nr:hypothetical protein [Verrucomicrobiales bacterium]
MRALCLLILSGLALAGPTFSQDKAGTGDWHNYRNARFGFVLPVPPGLKADRAPDNGGGQRFFSTQRGVDLVCWGSFNVDGLGDVTARWESELATEGRKITYKVKKTKWYVVSGVTTYGVGFYTRYEADANHCAGWTLTYPQAEEKTYSAWVERIARGWEARLGQGEDRIEAR